MVELLSAAGRVLGFECEGDVVFLVRLQLVSRELESLHIRSLLQLQSHRLVLGPACGQDGALEAAGGPADLGQDRLAGLQAPPPPQPPPGLAGAGNPSVGVGSVVTPVGGVSTPAGVPGASHHPPPTSSCTETVSQHFQTSSRRSPSFRGC